MLWYIIYCCAEADIRQPCEVEEDVDSVDLERESRKYLFAFLLAVLQYF